VWELVAQLYRVAPDSPPALGAFDPARVATTFADLDPAFDIQTDTEGAADNAYLDPQIRVPR
jgi:hypothetical protein